MCKYEGFVLSQGVRPTRESPAVVSRRRSKSWSWATRDPQPRGPLCVTEMECSKPGTTPGEEEVAMRAAVMWEQGKPLEIEEVELREVGPDEVRLKFANSGICRSDLSIAHGHNSQMQPPVPAILGH